MIIDIVGLPGAGKTTLANFVIEHDHRISIETFPYYKNLRKAPFFVNNLIKIIPNLLQANHCWRNGWFTRRDLASMVVLNGWSRVLKQQASEEGKTILLDEGAVELLAWLVGFGSDYLKGDQAKDWWEQTYEQWARTLDMIIQLETPIPVLLARIRARDNGWVKESDSNIIKMMTIIHAAQEQVLGILAAQSACPILRFNTMESSPRQIGHEILNWLHGVDFRV